MWSRKNLFETSVILLYALPMLWVGWFYFEPWRDQAHIWVILRDTGWWDIFTTIPSNLHPFLWFLMVKPLVVLGLPYQSSIILNILCCCFAVFLLVKKAPLPVGVKALFVFSYPLIYEFSFPGRIYALGVLLSFLIATYFRDRHKYPLLFIFLLALSFHTHTLFLAFSVPVLLLFVYESWRNKKLFTRTYLISWALIGSSGLYMLWYVSEVGRFRNLLNFGRLKNTLLDCFELGLTGTSGQFGILALFTLLLFIFMQIRKPFIFLASLFALGFAGYSYEEVLPNFIRYYLILPVILISLWWIYEEYGYPMPRANPKTLKSKQKEVSQKKEVSFWKYPTLLFQVLFTFCLAVSCYQGITKWIEEIRSPHSDAGQAAKFLNDKKLQDHILIGHRSYLASSIVPYLPKGKSIWYADRQEFGTYLKLDSVYYLNNTGMTYPEALKAADKEFGRGEKILLALGRPLGEEYRSAWNLIYYTKQKPIQLDEAYYFYIRK